MHMNRSSRIPLLIILLAFVSLWLPDIAFAHGMSEEEKQSIISGGNLSYLWLGATHMLTGYDHLAFVFGIIFFLKTFREIAKYVTAFTVGHSITLVYATFNGIQMNYFLIDAVIALSVCYIAFHNLGGLHKYLGFKQPNMMLIITGLGLIHGLGLSTRLQQLPLSEDQLLMNIVSFNVGIELGQISALLVMLLLIFAWRHTHFFTSFSKITNMGLIVFGGLLFLMQMHGYEHNANAQEYAQNNTSELMDESSKEKKGVSEWKDVVTVTIPARGDKEYKVYVDKEQSFSYSWITDGEVLFYDLHGEPQNDTTGYFQSFEKSTESQSEGSLSVPFSGTFGWYWKNNTSQPVIITLKTKGSYKLLEAK